MVDTQSLAVLLDARDPHAERRRYRIWALIEAWKRVGIDAFATRDPDEALRADSLLPHLDLSRVPDRIWTRIESHPRLLNRCIRDIRKTAISRYLLRRGDAHSGPVIVKTNANSGGFRDLERTLPPALHAAGIAWHRLLWSPLLRRPGWRWTRLLARYPVFPSMNDVPLGVWANPHLVVERFFEPDHDAQGRYAMHMWIVLGDRGTGRTLAGDDAVVKDSNASLASFERPHEAITAFQCEHGIDYGKIDYVLHKGEPIVLDVNPTPVVTGEPRSDRYIRECGDLASGINATPLREVLSVDERTPAAEPR